jgi:hypothetical protein
VSPLRKCLVVACLLGVGAGLGLLAAIFLPSYGSWALLLFVVVFVVPAVMKRVRARRVGSL